MPSPFFRDLLMPCCRGLRFQSLKLYGALNPRPPTLKPKPPTPNGLQSLLDFCERTPATGPKLLRNQAKLALF